MMKKKHYYMYMYVIAIIYMDTSIIMYKLVYVIIKNARNTI
jgi:hypothetical protein